MLLGVPARRVILFAAIIVPPPDRVGTEIDFAKTSLVELVRPGNANLADPGHFCLLPGHRTARKRRYAFRVELGARMPIHAFTLFANEHP